MITVIFGAPGAGKSALNTFFLRQLYQTEGRSLLAKSTAVIRKVNAERGLRLTVPARAPIFSDYEVKIRCGYDRFYQPYKLNGYYFGIPHEGGRTQFVPPCSKIFLTEVQRYYDSHKTLPGWVSRAFEMHRHFGLDLYLELQRSTLININIRALGKRFIEVMKMENRVDQSGQIERSVFCCREWTNEVDLKAYLDSGAKTYKETKYFSEGNIYRNYDSFNFFDEFLPEGKKDFNYLEFISKSEREKIASEDKVFYLDGEPKEYRGKAAKE